MPPVTKAGGSAFRKDVAFAETKDSDEFELEAAGIVMVPDKADLQNDFAREGTIRGFADQFATFAEAGQAGGGIMHAVWPDGWMELTRNEVLDEAAEIGGRTVDAGAWVQRWGVANAELAALIDDGILEGYSIGAIQVDWNGPFEQDAADVDDVDTSEIPDDELVWELTDGIIREVSAVDIPAVPDAQILEAKADAEKRLAEHVGNRDAFIEEAMERGHTEADAERLWDVLNEAVEADGSAQPGKQTVFARAGKAFLQALTGADDDDSSEAPDRAAKEGQTLSAANRDAAMAAVDANLDMLHDAGMDVPKRFTDREDVDFDLTEHQARSFDDGDDGGMFPLAASRVTKGEALSDFLEPLVEDAAEEDDVDEADIIDRIAEAAGMDSSTIANIVNGDIECPPRERFDAFAEELDATVEELIEAAEADGCEYDDVENANHATGGDTPADDTTDMSDTDGGGDDKSLAEQNAEQIDELTDAVKALTDAVEGGSEPEGDKTAEVELPDGSVAEVSKSEAMEWFEDADGTAEASTTEAAATKADIEALHARLDAITREAAGSQQLDQGGDDDGDGGLAAIGKALS